MNIIQEHTKQAASFRVFVCFIELSCDRLHQYRANGLFLINACVLYGYVMKSIRNIF